MKNSPKFYIENYQRWYSLVVKRQSTYVPEKSNESQEKYVLRLSLREIKNLPFASNVKNISDSNKNYGSYFYEQHKLWSIYIFPEGIINISTTKKIRNPCWISAGIFTASLFM